MKNVLDARHIDRFVLVAWSEHMFRSLTAFRAVDLDPNPSPARLRSDREDPPWMLMPDDESLVISDGAPYEYLAVVHCRLRGWLVRPGS